MDVNRIDSAPKVYTAIDTIVDKVLRVFWNSVDNRITHTV